MRTVIAIVTAVALGNVANAHGFRDLVSPCTSAYTPFMAVGCYDNSDVSSLEYRTNLDQTNMTIEQCTAECKSNGFHYAGLEYHGVCYCGTTIDGPKLDDSQCNQPCTGNPKQICGSDTTMSIWSDPTFTKGVNDVAVKDYAAIGCWTDENTIGRTLGYPMSLDPSNQTPQACIDACRTNGFPLAGSEYGGECWCGAVLPSDSTNVDASQCNMACNGDSSQMCGGPNRLNVFFAPGLASSQPCQYSLPVIPAVVSSVVPVVSSVVAPIVSSVVAPIVSSVVAPVIPIVSSIIAPIIPASSNANGATSVVAATTTAKATTTAAGPLCTVVQTAAPTCEFQIGNWCAPPLPNWTSKDQCATAAKTCLLQVASCFTQAGWPAGLNCFNFSQWCGNVQTYCGSNSPTFNKGDCWKKNSPGGVAPSMTTVTLPCAATSTLATSTIAATSTSCPPNPTNICTQPTNVRFGYGPGNSVGGFDLPVVGCNDIKSDFNYNPFKFYNNANTKSCSSFSWNQRSGVCQEACMAQYSACNKNYVSGCGNTSWKNWFSKRGEDETEAQFQKRTLSFNFSDLLNCALIDSAAQWQKPTCDSPTCWGRGANTPTMATNRCKAQLSDCLAVNSKVSPGNSCKAFCQS